jgi:hypothetical protein
MDEIARAAGLAAGAVFLLRAEDDLFCAMVLRLFTRRLDAGTTAKAGVHWRGLRLTVPGPQANQVTKLSLLVAKPPQISHKVSLPKTPKLSCDHKRSEPYTMPAASRVKCRVAGVLHRKRPRRDRDAQFRPPTTGICGPVWVGGEEEMAATVGG